MQIKKKIWIIIFGLVIIMGQTNLSYGQWVNCTNGGTNNCNSSGYVGIGTNVPSSKLSIGTNDTYDYLTIARYSAGDPYSYISSMGSGFKFERYGAGVDMTISSGGVGIGTLSPGRQLHLEKSGGNEIRLRDSNLTVGTFWEIQNGAFVSDMFGVVRYEGGSGVPIKSFVIANSGNVGIGTTNPGRKLSVNGIIRAHELELTTNAADYADFVFADNYKLMPLAELEKSIKQNKHLPEIPTAEEVEKNGLSMGKMQVKLLQKVEELTLYMIALQKENEKLKERIEKIEK